MSAAWLTFLGIVFVALCGLAGTIGAQRVIARANRATAAEQIAAQKKADADRHDLEERKVNREDFDAITRELRTSIAELRIELNAAESAREAAETRANLADTRAERAEARALKAERAAQRLEHRVTQLEDVLRANDMTIPPQPASA